ncbi:hypothetical protein P168DRAFT_286054 [Aspergillus campestris IBT 28561]|uniref:Uncharacterized protein n=1 Tax=Aspergillus campestris (strain IBT 28561) TaxID=1392248 RepID=A0A2I1DDB7_ASPC2|nr:uncharacterized protein P168DRAFT_286054 [Aspergillus campestris IBT 28561]PKY07872.1 hypothetical protein P168DRAFT_286054 [Aspergillus campestris IBT 28561]
MDPSSDLIPDTQYRLEVLHLPSEDAESERDQQLVDEARQLGLKVPEIELVASLTASIASGMVDLSSSPILSSGSSADRQSLGDATASPSLDQVTTSLFDCTLSSEPIQTGSARSTASPSTRPTSYSSSEGRPPPDNHHRHLHHHYPHHHTSALRLPGHRASVQSAASSDRELRKERRKSSLKSAIGKIHFLKKRSPSSVLLPPAAHITVTKTDDGGVDKVYLESKPNESQGQGQGPDEENPHHPADDNPQVLRLEIPVFDQESLQRSQTNVELRQMRDAQKLERSRHLMFHDAAIRRLRDRHQAAVSDQLAEHKQAEEAKREQNLTDAARIEERQLSIEIDQEREFERAKINSRTRIKYMEGYFRTSSPPPSTTTTTTSEPTSPSPDQSPEPIPRKFTPQHKAQLAQEYHAHSSMDQLHNSRIKVLRDRQERRLQDAVARMDRELDALIDAHAVAFANLHRAHQQEEMALTRGLDARKARLRHRWNLEEAVLRRRLEVQHGEGVLFGPLPLLLFNDGLHGGGSSGEMSRDSAICVTDEEMV